MTREAFDLLMLTLQCAHATQMIRTCVQVANDLTLDPDDRRLAREVLYDALADYATAREALVDRGADLEAAIDDVLRGAP